MAFEYRGRTGIEAIALLAALILLLPADAEASQCRSEKRVDVRDAECLSASWRNPSTGEAVSISASTSPTFKAGKTLKDAVNAGSGS